MNRTTRFKFWAVLIIFLVIYWLARFGVGLYTDLLWFQQVGFDSVFLTSLWAKVGVGLVIALPVAVVFWASAFFARWQSIRSVLFFSEDTLVAQNL